MKKINNIFKTFIVIIVITIVISSVWFGTVLLQKPPKYPTLQMDINKLEEDYRMSNLVSKEDLIKDIDAFINYTDEIHADPYRVITKESFIKKANEIKLKISSYQSESISSIDAFYFLQELAVFIKDGHTTIYPLNWEKTVDNMFPLIFTSIDGRIFVKYNFGNNDIPERSEILAINKVSIKQMTDEGMKYIPGTLIHLKQKRFAQLLGLIIQTYYKMHSPWQVTYKHKGNILTTTVWGISLESLKKSSALKKQYDETEIIVNAEKVPVLELNFTGFEGGEWDDFKSFVDNFFAKNKNNQYIVIDARFHGGGNGTWMYYVLSYLTSNLKGYKEDSFKVSPFYQRIIKFGFNSVYYDMHIPNFLWGLPLYKFVEQDDPEYWASRGVLESKPGTFYYCKWENEKLYISDKISNRFYGKIFILTSHETFSAGANLAGLFKTNKLGLIIGRETGGRVYMQSDMVPVFLHNSNLMYFIPTARLIVGNDNPDRGVIPDIIVDYSPEDYINYKDRDIEKVIDLIKKDISKRN